MLGVRKVVFMWDKLKEQLNLLKLEKKKLCLITNSDKFLSKDDFLDAIASALQGGVEIVLFRENNFPDNVKVELGRKIRALCDEFGATFIVNDRPDIAMIVEADGVHLGQDDINIIDVRYVLGENAIIGKTCTTTDEIIEAVNEGVDYVNFGPFSSKGKSDFSIEDEAILWVAENIDIPVFIFGEITPKNLPKLVSLGTNRIAISESLIRSKVPEHTAREILNSLPH